MWEGAPAGISKEFQLGDLLEHVGDEDPIPIGELSSDPESFCNYQGVESDEAAMAIIDSYISNGWVKEFRTYNEAVAFVGAKPVLNKIAALAPRTAILIPCCVCPRRRIPHKYDEFGTGQ